MKFRRVEAAAAAQAAHASLSLYQLTLNGFSQPFVVHAVFNALAAVSLTLLGHPITGFIAFVSYCGVDLVQQRLVARWLKASDGADEAAGFRRLAPMCAARFTIYLAPSAVVALNGGVAEVLYFGLHACTLIAVAMAAGMLSRRIFWAFVAPILAFSGGVAVARLSSLPAAGVLLSLAALAGLLALMLEGVIRTIATLHAAFNDNIAMIPELTATRDQAVTERAAADDAREAARQAERAKSNFLATMSHEIRTPMNGVLGMAQLLQRDEIQPAQKERLTVLIESGEYLLAILNDILDVSKIDAGRLDILPAAEDVRLLLDRLVGFWGPRADEKGVALVLDMKASVPDFAMIDALRLRQVLFNLVGNALKFTEQGSVSVIAAATPNGEGAVLLHIAVRDTGMGISAEHLPRLFARFTQGDQSEVRKFGGTGLGLTIAKQLMELMGGEIWAESELGEGATFHIRLPLAVVPAATPRLRAATPDAGAVPDALQVLAVDDNAVNLMVLDQLLASFGHEVAKASSGAEALAALADRAFDIVLLDIQMPGMSGIEVLQHLRASEGPNRHAPVVALTADVTSGGRRRYLELGFTEHSPKPIQIQDLMDCIARAVAAPSDRRQAGQAA